LQAGYAKLNLEPKWVGQRGRPTASFGGVLGTPKLAVGIIYA